MQKPGEMSDAVLPETVQVAGAVDEKVIGRPELAVADRLSVVPRVCGAMAGKVMVWPSSLTTITRLTFGAAAY